MEYRSLKAINLIAYRYEIKPYHEEIKNVREKN
jgi:hypothetical protein